MNEDGWCGGPILMDKIAQNSGIKFVQQVECKLQ